MINKKKGKKLNPAPVDVPDFDSEVISDYWVKQEQMSPFRYHQGVKRLWVFSIVIILASFILNEFSFHIVKSKNDASSVTLLRIDGFAIEESNDVRRDVLFETTKRRNLLKQGLIITRDAPPENIDNGVEDAPER